MGGRIFLAATSRRRPRRRRHLLRPPRGPFRRAFRLHARRRRGFPRYLPKDRPRADEHALQRRGHRPTAHLPWALCRVQPSLRPRDLVRAQDRRQYRRRPDEPPTAGKVEVSCEPVADGKLAAVVTYLEIRERPAIDVPASPLKLRRIEGPDTATYRELFQLVGAPWLWFSRLVMEDAKLASIIQDPHVELFAVIDATGRDAGMLELDFREPGECELVFIGLVPELAGHGHGNWLLTEPLRRAWRAHS